MSYVAFGRGIIHSREIFAVLKVNSIQVVHHRCERFRGLPSIECLKPLAIVLVGRYSCRRVTDGNHVLIAFPTTVSVSAIMAKETIFSDNLIRPYSTRKESYAVSECLPFYRCPLQLFPISAIGERDATAAQKERRGASRLNGGEKPQGVCCGTDPGSNERVFSP